MSQPTNEIIPIRTVEDLIQLDERQLDACLRDLKTWVVFRKDMNAKIELGIEHLKAHGVSDEDIQKMRDGVEMQDHMAWVDDGIEGGDVTVEIKDEDGNVLTNVDLKVDGEGQVSA